MVRPDNPRSVQLGNKKLLDNMLLVHLAATAGCLRDCDDDNEYATGIIGFWCIQPVSPSLDISTASSCRCLCLKFPFPFVDCPSSITNISQRWTLRAQHRLKRTKAGNIVTQLPHEWTRMERYQSKCAAFRHYQVFNRAIAPRQP